MTTETKIGVMGGTGGTKKYGPHLHIQISDKFTIGPYGYLTKDKDTSFSSPNGYFKAIKIKDDSNSKAPRGEGHIYYDPMKVIRSEGQLILDSKETKE